MNILIIWFILGIIADIIIYKKSKTLFYYIDSTDFVFYFFIFITGAIGFFAVIIYYIINKGKT